jgi:integrase
MAQAESLLEAAMKFRTPAIRAYVVVSLLTGGRTEEMRALTWANVDLTGAPDVDPPVLPSIRVWRSVRVTGDTKTRLSRRTLAMPKRCLDVLAQQREAQASARQVRRGRTGTSSSAREQAVSWRLAMSGGRSASSRRRPG